jgi:GNAT superfamily N-acetyltransferase
VEIVSLDPRLHEAAARLQCRQYEALRRAGIAVPPRLLDHGRALEAVSSPRGPGPAVAAMDGGRLIGFLRADVRGEPVRMQHRAAEPDRLRPIVRALYAAVAGDLVERGELRHQVDVLADDAGELEVWFQLGFGIDQIKGLRRAGAAAVEAPSGIRLRLAGDGDLDALADLSEELIGFHERSPIIRRTDYPRERAVDSFRDNLASEESALFVAEASGRVIGFVDAGVDGLFDGTGTIYGACTASSFRGRGVGGALVAMADTWAAGRGHASLSVGWTSANLVSDPFWRGLGFRPGRYRLARDFHDPPPASQHGP